MMKINNQIGECASSGDDGLKPIPPSPDSVVKLHKPTLHRAAVSPNDTPV